MFTVMGILDFFKKKLQKSTEEERYILCIDGGGMRGIIPAVILQKLAEQLKSLGDKRPLYAHFDLIAGTSTGGLIALALSAPCSRTSFVPEPVDEGETIPPGIDVQQLLDIYLQYGKQIFPRILHGTPLNVIGQVFAEKYDIRPLEQLLKVFFEDLTIDEATVPVMVMSYDTNQGEPYPISSREHCGFLMRAAARATSAAPTFFPPLVAYQQNSQNRKLTLIDGGVVANNPVLYAYREAKKLYPNAKIFHVLSISTAPTDYHLDATKTGGGFLGWMDPTKGAPIQKIYTAAQMQTSSIIAEALPSVNYTRIHGQMDEHHIHMDDTNEATMKKMVEHGNRIFTDHQPSIQDYCIRLAARTNFDQLHSAEKHEAEVSQFSAEPEQKKARLTSKISSIFGSGEAVKKQRGLEADGPPKTDRS